MSKIVRKEVCKCEKCGNEAEMVISCTLPDTAASDENKNTSKSEGETGLKRVKGNATCSLCGNEADMWIDI